MKMKKTLLLLLCVIYFAGANAQLSSIFSKKKKTTDTTHAVINPKPASVYTPTVKKDWSKVDLSKRPADHFMFQYGYDNWIGSKPDSVKTKGFSRHFNFYVMFDKPLKNNKKFSVAYGLGLGSSNIIFDHRYVKVWANSPTLPFDSTTRFNKSKLTTMYVEAPAELRYYSNPENPGKSWKAAIGVKVGTLIKAYFKGKDLLDQNGNSLFGPTYIKKEYDKKFFNSTTVTASARFGYGFISLHTEYQITSVIKPGFGPDMHTLSIGLCISGL
jgi:hypothetical protein